MRQAIKLCAYCGGYAPCSCWDPDDRDPELVPFPTLARLTNIEPTPEAVFEVA